VSSARRELFPELADDVVLDIEEDPFADEEATGETATEADEAEEVMGE
jgi:hypothetical protein